MNDSRTHIALAVAAVNPVGAWMRSPANHLAIGAGTTHSSLAVMPLR